mmetsp:Transcript_15556/g.21857  ORF Transcript_15556/g.21857 Transcript_15556/m.21857 type:complete len:187 (+) Transcript_15556:105-665(+)
MPLLRCKVAIVGDAEVGKSALTTMFHKSSKPANYVMTLGVDFCVKTVKIPNEDSQVELYLFDTSGHDIYAKLRHKYWEGASWVVVVYDCTDKKSFDNCANWIAELNKAVVKGSGKLQGVLVASKSDLKDSAQVTSEQGAQFAYKNGFGFFECSALTGKDVDAPFNFIANAFNLAYQERVKLLTEDL